MTADVVEKPADIPWWLVLLNGICLVIIGILFIVAPGKTALLLVQFIGIYWLIAGIFSIIRIFLDSSGWGWNLFSGVLGIIAGILVLQHPLWSTVLIPTTLVIVFGVYGLIAGVIALIEAFRGGFSWGPLILGIISIVFGLILVLNPLIGAYTLVVWVAGIWGLIAGIAAIVVAFKIK
jgi:uncharacterized membrane protein HdeD (DUF308 family)